MAALPSPTQVAGSHNALYEAYYYQVDPNNQGSIGALEAASFLKRSGLPDDILSKVWDFSNPTGKSYLNKDGFFVALKLVSLAQSGRDVNMVNITTDSPPPKMGDVPPVMSVHNNIISPPILNSTSTSDWAVKPAEKAKYDQLFDSLQPLNGMIPGNKVKGLLMDSKLPLDTLGKIWDLADMDKDGMLDCHEFMVAMHLVYKALEKYSIPSVLPPELLPPTKCKTSAVVPGLVMVMDGTKPPPIPPLPVVWVVTPEEKLKYDTLFHQTDIDKDGYVSGLEIKDVFLQSGVPQSVLARIWTLCDTKQCGKLNSEQFALAMWLISQKLKGIDPPATLHPEMMPPSLRTPQTTDTVLENNNTGYSNPELDMITKDIEELAKEKHVLEADIAQKEADIKIKTGEIKSLQSELDTLAATLKQLENQKGEAQKRLTDLKNQKSSIEKELTELKGELEEEQTQVDNLRKQAEEQEQTLKLQEDELNSKKQELEGLKQEEANLEQQQKESRNKLDDLTKNLQDTQLQISQAKAKISHLQELHRQMNDAVHLYDSAIESGDTSVVPDTSFNINPEFRDAEYVQATLVNGTKTPEQNTTVNGGDPFSGLNGPLGYEEYDNEDLFKNDPFDESKPRPDAADPFSANDPFAAAFSPKSNTNIAGDPFRSLGGSNSGKTDPFDPFGDSSPAITAKSPGDVPGKDPFGCDPFALQPSGGGPPPRPESPSPALPPKKSKVPPPRPAPPRPVQGPPLRAAPAPPTPSPDPFSNDLFEDSVNSAAPAPVPNDPFSNSTGSTGFADFANFDSKFSGPAAGSVHSPAIKSSNQGNTSTTSAQSRYSHLEFTEDPFQNYRYEDPFHIADPFEDDQNGNALSVTDNCRVNQLKMESVTTLISDKNSNSSGSSLEVKTNGSIVSGQRSRAAATLPPEDQQLAWAAAESLRLETERQERLKQEQADLEYALELSRAERKGV